MSALVGLVGCGADVLVVSDAGSVVLFAELQEVGLVPHLRGVTAQMRGLQGYLLERRGRWDKAVFLGRDDREARMAARAGFEVETFCRLIDGLFTAQ